jgi:hypothetical protein
MPRKRKYREKFEKNPILPGRENSTPFVDKRTSIGYFCDCVAHLLVGQPNKCLDIIASKSTGKGSKWAGQIYAVYKKVCS